MKDRNESGTPRDSSSPTSFARNASLDLNKEADIEAFSEDGAASKIDTAGDAREDAGDAGDKESVAGEEAGATEDDVGDASDAPTGAIDPKDVSIYLRNFHFYFFIFFPLFYSIFFLNFLFNFLNSGSGDTDYADYAKI